jgi:hypothetical protein
VPFIRVTENNDAGLFEWQPVTDAAWSGYLLTAGAGSLTELTAEQAWKNYWGVPIQGVNGGCYLFCSLRPSDAPALLARLLGYIAKLNNNVQGFAYRYLIWIENPDTLDDIRAQQIPFVRSGSSDNGQTQGFSSLKFRNIAFQVAAGVSLTADYDLPAISLLPFGSTSTLSFWNSIGVPKSFGAVTSAGVIAIAGEGAGRVEVPLRINVADSTLNNDLRTMRTGIEYFFERTDTVDTGSGPVEVQREVGMLNPDLDRSSVGVAMFRVWLDPLKPLDASRTAFTFVANSGSPPPQFASYYVTDAGIVVNLTPVADVSGYVLAREMYPLRFLDPKNVQTPTYYFTPTGTFVVASDPAPKGPTNLMCGLSATETIGFNPTPAPDKSTIVTFFPNMPAHAIRFPLPAVDLNDPGSPRVEPKLLDDTYTTSWATVTPAAPQSVEVDANNIYYSQPHGASLFADVGTALATKEGPPSLGFFLTKAADLGTPVSSQSYPLTPYRGSHLESTGASASIDIPAFEATIVSPTRKQSILSIKQKQGIFAKQNVPLPTEDLKPTTTPQGLLAAIATSSGARWQSILLAQNTDGGRTYKLEFSNIDPVLQDAFQTNQQFLVVTRPRLEWNVPGGTVFDNLMSIEGWPFRIMVAQNINPGDYRNVLIFKFMRGKLSDLVTNPSNWTSAADFNEVEAQGLPLVSQWLQDYIAEARAMATSERLREGQESYFRQFLDIVDSESWNGILALKVDVEVADFPPELKGLLAGIDLARFNAHHLGVNVNFVQTDEHGNPYIAGNSSLFGLIYYVNAAYEAQLALNASPDRPVPAPPGPYGFTVLTLKVLFENTAVKSFESRLQLTLNRWFGDSVQSIVDSAGVPQNLPSNSILLDGAYEERDGQSTFTFTSNSSRLFRLNSNVLGVVEVVQTTYSTLASEPGSDLVRSRFSMAGYMNFIPAEGMDVFSFGSSWTDGKPGQRQGLFFSNLFLDISFPESAPTLPTFAFIISEIAFNMAQSTTRSTSLFPNFPLSVSALLAATAEENPGKIGYLGVSLPEGVRFTGLKGDWHGLRMQLDLGTMGALANNAGLTAYLLAAWSPNSGGTPRTYDASVSIQLPGTGGVGKLFSFQGVLKLSIGSIELLLGETADGRPAYMLKMAQIALRFLVFNFPPSGNTVFFLFGDPQPGAPQNTFGWYAAYNKTNQQQPSSPGQLSGEPAHKAFGPQELIELPASFESDFAGGKGI